MSRPLLLCLTLLLLLLPPAPAQAQHSAAAPDTPPAASAHQFDFLLGTWTLEVRPKVSSLAALIHGAPRLLGTWQAQRAFDGRGVEDELRIVDAAGNPSGHSHALRIWSETEQRWQVSTLDVPRARFVAAQAEWREGEMHQQGRGVDADGETYLSRTRYHDIGPDGFRLSQERSYDEGASWDEVLQIVATRLPGE